MYAKLPDLDDPNIRHFIYNKYRIVYELIETEKFPSVAKGGSI